MNTSPNSSSPMCRLWSGLLCFLLLSFSLAAWGAPTHRTGNKPPSAASLAWMNANFIKTTNVPLNQLAIQRINAERAKKGLPPISSTDAPRFGHEFQSGGFSSIFRFRAGGDRFGGGDQFGAPPSAVDNSLSSAFPPIRNQLTLGSCAAFSTTYYTMTYMTAMARGIDAKYGDDRTRFSPKWTYNQINGGEDEGASFVDAMILLYCHGAATWQEMPYTDTNKPLCYREWSMNPNIWRSAINYRMADAGVVENVDTQAGLDAVKALLANGYILNYGTNIDGWVFRNAGNDPATSADDAFVGKPVVMYVRAVPSAHAMTVVGYNDNIWCDLNGNGTVDSGEKGAFRIANSWGTTWGEQGFAWISYDAMKETSAVAGAPSENREAGWWNKAAFWMTARESYNPTMLAKFSLNQRARNELQMTLGISNTSESAPTMIWESEALWNRGGSYAFDGTNNPVNAIFYLDFTDIAVRNVNQRWYLKMNDTSAVNYSTLRSYALVDVSRGIEIPCSGLPVTADNASRTVFIEYLLSESYRPDMLIRTESAESYLGDNIYNTTGLGQSAQKAINIGGKAIYLIKVQNDATLPDRLTLTGNAGSRGWRVQYFDRATGGNLITSDMSGVGWETPLLNSGGECTIRVEVDRQTGTLPTSPCTVTVIAASQAMPEIQDVVIAQTSGATPISSVVLTTSSASPQLINTPVLLAAQVTGGANVEYCFRAGKSATSGGPVVWTTLCPYGSSSTFTWLPATAGSYAVEVWAREVGSAKTYDARASLPFTLRNPMTALSLTASPASPRKAGTFITFKTTTTGGARIEYYYRVGQKVGTTIVWSTLRAYSLIPTCTWRPLNKGTYYIDVSAREVGSQNEYDLRKQMTFTVK